MTKPVSTPSDLAALPPGPGKATPAKRTPGSRDFAEVIDQASARKPAHVRGTKSSSSSRTHAEDSGPGRSREADGSAHSNRVRPTADTSPKPTSRKERLAARASEADADAPRETERPTQAGTKSLNLSKPSSASVESEESAETEAPTTEASAADLASTEETETHSAPTNIIPFPGPGGNVIVPFPLAEAQAIPAIVANAFTTSAGSTAAATETEESRSSNATAATAPPTVASAASTEPTQENRDGIDVTQLGLKPVQSGETFNVSSAAATPASSEPNATTIPAADIAPASTIFSVAFNSSAAITAVSEPGTIIPLSGSAEAVLPGEATEEEEAARQSRDTPASASSAKIVLLRTDAVKPAPDGARIDVPPAAAPAAERAGISSARQEDRMESMIASEELSANAAATESTGESPARIEYVARGTSAGSREATEFTDRTKVATDWQSGRSVSATDRAVPEPSASATNERTDAAASVERISSLVLREAGLVKKHGSDSMAVVLRPDAETELFVHLTRRDGQVEATVRCERGDTQHLGALWPQLQEALAQQKVRLAPLEESAAARNESPSQPGSWTSHGGDRGARQESRPSAQQSMDEWPAPPAAPAATPHVRGGDGTRGRRISTSRPGWETWA